MPRDLEKKREYNRNYAKGHRKEATMAMQEWREQPGNKEKERERQRIRRFGYFRDRYAANREKELAQRRFRKYGITSEQFNLMLNNQGGLCIICKKQMIVPHLDHNHETGKNRDLLCKNCNTGLGMFLENETFLNSAIEYLRRHRI